MNEYLISDWQVQISKKCIFLRYDIVVYLMCDIYFSKMNKNYELLKTPNDSKVNKKFVCVDVKIRREKETVGWLSKNMY